MREITGIVENGTVKLPSSVQLPEGLAVKIVWDDESPPYDREELEWATGEWFSSDRHS
ncbi:MAG: hypothetical protein ACI906_004774 [Candidatus Latescibacterota bacterium]|jgi:hypothetical protein